MNFAMCIAIYFMETEELIKKTREKTDAMAKNNVWRTDFRVCELLKELADKIRDNIATLGGKTITVNGDINNFSEVLYLM